MVENSSLKNSQNGIQRKFTALYTPQQHGVMARKNRTIMGLVRSMLKTSTDKGNLNA